MPRMLRAPLVAITLLGAAAPASAFWIDGFVDHVRAGSKANQRWPSPYVCQDRVYAHQAFDAMVANGWRRQNLLGSHHFTSDASQLTEAGRLKVQWIVSQTPPGYRHVFVERSLDPGVTQQRMQVAQQFATEVAMTTPGAGPARVVETHIVSEGRPAATVDYVNSQFRENMPIPTLPASTAEEGD